MRSLTNSGELPAPGAEAAAVSARLVETIRARIAEAGGRIPFAEFMQMALYAPGLGYYSAGARRFGPAGDFVTAPELSPLFGRCLARQCAEVLARLGGGNVLEFGAGSGCLAVDLLRELAALECLPERYLILEVSGALRQAQQERVRAALGPLAARVEWLDALPAPGLHGVVLANEVLDAMPVHRFWLGDAGPQELYVEATPAGLGWQPGPLSSPSLARGLQALLAALPEPLAPEYVSELSLAVPAWMHSLAPVLAAGIVLLIDYGFPRHEYYHPQRSQGTLICHYRHRAHADALLWPGLQDITAHVDFTAVAEAAVAAGLQVAGFTSQAAFLLAAGLPALVEAEADATPARRAQLGQQLNLLVSPAEMGELFKVMALRKAVDVTPSGFSLQDRRGRL